MTAPKVKIVCHQGPAWVSWGYVITWPDGSTDMCNGYGSREQADLFARKVVRQRNGSVTRGDTEGGNVRA